MTAVQKDLENRRRLRRMAAHWAAKISSNAVITFNKCHAAEVALRGVTHAEFDALIDTLPTLLTSVFTLFRADQGLTIFYYDFDIPTLEVKGMSREREVELLLDLRQWLLDVFPAVYRKMITGRQFRHIVTSARNSGL